jgi:acetyl-CoA carboxylase biotin carboxyl carrier protein
MIRSPIVGTFYGAPSPEAQDYVSKNSKVDIDTTVCIIEPITVLNEIQAEVNVMIVEVLVQNG